MIELYAAGIAIAIASLLFLAGYLVGRRNAGDEQAIEHVLGQVAARREQDIQQLRRLRIWLETETGGVTTEQALLLTDVCTQLDYSEAETQHVVGPAYWLVVDVPIGLSATEEMEDDK